MRPVGLQLWSLLRAVAAAKEEEEEEFSLVGGRVGAHIAVLRVYVCGESGLFSSFDGFRETLACVVCGFLACQLSQAPFSPCPSLSTQGGGHSAALDGLACMHSTRVVHCALCAAQRMAPV
jgi:hypothetical protein